MPSDIDNLRTRRTAVAAELAALVGMPDTSLDGQSVQRVAHRKALLEEFQSLTELINALEPFDFSIQGTP